MIKGDNGWTVVDTLDHEAVDFQWPTYDYLWMIDINNDKFLSRDQGKTFTKMSTLGWIWLQIRMKIRSVFNGVKFGR